CARGGGSRLVPSAEYFEFW
nr:immunoglobulin heavy chain junction region [Macaca mulatta]MOX00172.1 immunoglobulin heavy chain junction region [Macaca mulatta]MOX01086.1 immunoglobulin heavy chain junction region [Macaca mulatta]MOX01681.1 immunoglobulin heavy chain junction region [Macaca mulatta]MOX01926.1 immunoglobulin heavy chain junction region [Macaca mulatta]